MKGERIIKYLDRGYFNYTRRTEMKKITAVVLSLVLLLSFAGCGKNTKPADKSKTKTEEKQTNNSEDSADSKDTTNLKIDVDLTKLSKTMVYSEVLNMMQSPKKYIGKVVKMKGTCSVLDDAINQKTYYSCIIQDATACCAQGLEFVPVAGVTKPKDDQEIIVTGDFEMYQYHGYDSFRLNNASVQLAKK